MISLDSGSGKQKITGAIRRLGNGFRHRQGSQRRDLPYMFMIRSGQGSCNDSVECEPTELPLKYSVRRSLAHSLRYASPFTRVLTASAVACAVLVAGTALGRADDFQVSYAAGSRDEAGRFAGGTEVRLLTPHVGRLYAGNGYWEDRPGPEGLQGAQILVRCTRRALAGRSCI